MEFQQKIDGLGAGLENEVISEELERLEWRSLQPFVPVCFFDI